MKEEFQGLRAEHFSPESENHVLSNKHPDTEDLPNVSGVILIAFGLIAAVFFTLLAVLLA